MLKEISIENLAIIEKATISFCEKFNIFSGETGAGKSILIGGINAILGGRVSKDIVRSGTDKAVITALFDDVPRAVREKLKENGYQCDDELLLQREISSDGKSTARISGRTATVSVLKEVAADLIDIHGQNDNRILMSTDRQLEILDNYAELGDRLSDYKESFRAFSAISKKIKTLQEQSREGAFHIESLKERVEEIEAYKFSKGEADEVEKRLNKARSFEHIQRSLRLAYMNITGADDGNGAINLLRVAKDEIKKALDDGDNQSELASRLESLLIELDDIKTEVSSEMSDSFNPQELAVLEERMSDILRIQRKYSMTLDDLLDKLSEWKRELDEYENSDEIIEKLMAEKRALADVVKAKANEISNIRKSAAQNLEEKITSELTFLEMPNVRLFYDFRQDKITLNGMDSVEMLISVNKGEEPKPVNKVASGGELSRIMLAIKSVLATNDDIPTMIFDEIDTGISGKAAQKTGIKLSEIAQKRQVLCVTHLAQIAALADNHLLIEKNSDDKRTYTSIKPLSFEERKREIARIISGDSASEITLKNAEELLLRKNII